MSKAHLLVLVSFSTNTHIEHSYLYLHFGLIDKDTGKSILPILWL